MNWREGQAWQASFVEFFASFGGYFKRAESRQSAQRYIRGLLAEVKRKNCWQLAEMMGETHPDGLQRLLYGADWDEEGVGRQLRAQMVERLGYAPGIGVIDESGFVKKGRCSAGVKRQYCGRVGKIENCQVGVYLGYVAPQGHALLDRELYLPQEWCEDAVRRAGANIPETVTFATKPALAQRLLERAWADGVPLHWVVGDSPYGKAPTLRAAMAAAGRYYVLEMPKTARVQSDGQPWQTVEVLAASMADEVWPRYALNLGEQGWRWSDWAALRVVANTDELGEQWLLIRRTVAETPEVTYFLSNAPQETALAVLAQVAGSRYHIEPVLQEAKGTTGLAQYAVRYWHSWYRHMTRALVAHAWLTLLRLDDAQKNSPALSLLGSSSVSPS